jgi:hypothetical protein
MIQDHQQFEAALTQAERHLDAPPNESSLEHAHFMTLLKDLAAYRPTVLDATSGGQDSDLDRLGARLKAFEARVIPHYGPHWHSLIGGDFGH